MTYLVTGATGGFGGYAINHLKDLVPQSEIVALARSEAKAAPLRAAGFHVRIGDYADKASLENAFAGIERLLLVSGAPGNRQTEHKNVIEAAKKAGVRYIAYTSFASADTATSPLAADHVFTEKIIRESGIPHTFLRNNWYLENELPIIGSALDSGSFVFAAGDGKTGWALKREYAEVAAKALAGSEFPEILELSGKPITYDELAAALSIASGKKLAVKNGSDTDFTASLTAAGIPQEAAAIFLAIQHDIKNGGLDVTSADFEKALGRPLTALVPALKEILN